MRNITYLAVASAFMLAACHSKPAEIEVEDSLAIDSMAIPEVLAKEDITRTVINIERLKPPKKALETIGYAEIVDRMLKDCDLKTKGEVVAYSRQQEDLVSLPHPFFDGMHKAYAEHRPFVLSPDAVWLLICQGFSQHVNINAEKLRSGLVGFEGKRELIVEVPVGLIHQPHGNWEAFFPQFTKQIADYTGQELIDVLGSRFSTTTKATYTASQITIMAAMQKFFDYTFIEMCGIPYVILEGTPDDWQRIVDNMQELRKDQYQLAWWVDELLPILKKIQKASAGEVDKSFWKGMYKVHDLEHEMCGDPYVLSDGWIVKFYPYDRYGNRNSLKGFYDGNDDDIPSEVANVPMTYKPIGGGASIPLTLWAGFMGLSQDSETFALRPEIGWFITKGAEPSQDESIKTPKKAQEALSKAPKQTQVELSKETEDDEVEDGGEEIFIFSDQRPEFPGGKEALDNFFKQNIRYPKAAKDNVLEGKVYIRFVVEKDGTLSNFKVMRDIGGGCGAEAIRVAQTLPRWKPGKIKGRSVRVQYDLPVKFEL